jgi:AraC family transcriptional regulator, alkane utilization regulator
MVYNGNMSTLPHPSLPSGNPGHLSPRRSPVFPHPDPLTQVLDSVRLRCMLPSAHEMTAPWGVQFGGIDPAVLRRHTESMGLEGPREPPPLQGSIVAVLRGNCCLELPRQKVKLPLAGGDVVLISRQDPLILRDDWRSAVRNIHELVRREDIEHLRGIRHGGGGVPTSFLSGMFFFEDDEDHPLLTALPPVIHIRAASPEAPLWLDSTLKFINSEMTTLPPGFHSIVNHLAHVLFVAAVRTYAAALPPAAPGNWFRALFDRELAPALGQIHAHPDEPWTVASLADLACLSRSGFSARFTACIGKPPLQYLTECRMRKALQLLRETNLGVKTIGLKVGYSNESAFSNAFRRTIGTSPGTYRRNMAARKAP